MELDFKELSNDHDLISRMNQFSESIDQIEKILKFGEDPDYYANLSNQEKIKFNLLMSFSLNSLFWMYLRAEGIDPTKHQIKTENERLKQTMARAKQIHDRNTIMPRIDRDAAQRFVKHGLWVPVKEKIEENENSVIDETQENWDK